MDRSITTVLGKTRSGKSEFITGKDGHVQKPLVREMPKPVYLLDPMHEFSCRDFVIYDGEGRSDGHPVLQMLEMLKRGDTTQFDYHVVRPYEDASMETKMAQCRDFFRAIDGGSMNGTIVVDEMHLFGNARQAIKPIQNMVLMGGHSGQHLIFTAKRPTLISKTILAESNCVICFRQNKQKDVDRIEEDYDNQMDRVNAIRELPKYKYVALGEPSRLPYSNVLNPVQ
jgi:hypothetical protein